MKTYCGYFLIVFLCSFKDCCSLKSLRITLPELIESGQSATLTCDYDLEDEELYAIKWYKNNVEFFRFVPKESPPFQTFSVEHISVDVALSGPNKVTLKDVRKELTGIYVCEVSADFPSFHTEMRRDHMTIAELPAENPVLSVKPTKIELGTTIKAKCTSPNSFPAPQLLWSINNDQINETTPEVDIKTYVSNSESHPGLQESLSYVEFVANQSLFRENGSLELKCDATIGLLWNKSVSTVIRDGTPVFSPVLGSKSSRSVIEGSSYDMLSNGASSSSSGSPIPAVLYAKLALLIASFR